MNYEEMRRMDEYVRAALQGLLSDPLLRREGGETLEDFQHRIARKAYEYGSKAKAVVDSIAGR